MSKLSLKTYTSEELRIVGNITVAVTSQSQRHNLKLIVAEGEDPGGDLHNIGLGFPFKWSLGTCLVMTLPRL